MFNVTDRQTYGHAVMQARPLINSSASLRTSIALGGIHRFSTKNCVTVLQRHRATMGRVIEDCFIVDIKTVDGGRTRRFRRDCTQPKRCSLIRQDIPRQQGIF